MREGSICVLCLHHDSVRSLAIFHVFKLLLEFLDDFLAKMRTLGQLLFDFFMNCDVSVQSFNFLLHLIVSKQKLLGLLALILQLRRQLMILKNGQACRSL